MLSKLLYRGIQQMPFLLTAAISTIRPVSVFQFQLRSFGIFSSIRDNVMDKVDEKKKKTSDKGFKEMMEKLADYTVFGMKEYKDTFVWLAEKSGVNGWKSHIPGVGKMGEVQEMKKYISILDTMTPMQLAKPNSMKAQDRLKLAEDTKLTVEYVNKVLRMYDQQYVMYKWIHMRKDEGKPIPTTTLEMKDMMSRDHTGITMKDMMKLSPQQNKYQNPRQKMKM